MFKVVLIMGTIFLYGFSGISSELDKIFPAKGMQPENPTLPIFFKNMKDRKISSIRDTAWHMVGPGEGGTCRYIYVHPKKSNLVFMFNDMTSSYRSEDGGMSWQSIIDCDGNGMTPSLVEGMAFAPNRPELGYAAGRGGVFKTEDYGKNWKKIEYDFGGPVCAVAIDPDNSDMVFIGSGQKIKLYTSNSKPVNPGKIFVTRNGGKKWIEIFGQTAPGAQLWKIYIDPTSPKNRRRIFVASTSGFFVSDDYGITWRKAGKGLPHDKCADLAVYHDVTKNKVILYLAMWTVIDIAGKRPVFSGGVFKSNDGGEHWHEISGNLYFDYTGFTAYMKRTFGWWFGHECRKAGKSPRQLYSPVKVIQNFNNIYVSSKDPNTIYLGVLGYNGRHSFAPYGIWKTNDSGKKWEMITRRGKEWNSKLWKNREQIIEDNIDIGWLVHKKRSISEVPYNQFDTRGMAVSKTNPDIVYFSTVHAVYKSCDGGKTWKNTDTDHVKNNMWTGRGNSNIVAYRAFIDPRRPDTVFLGSMDMGLAKTIDGGKSFIPLYNRWGDAETMAFHPKDPKIMFVGKGRGGKGDRGVILKTNNGGSSWEKIEIPLIDATRTARPTIKPINCIRIEKHSSPGGQRRMYLCSAANGRSNFHLECTKPGNGVIISDNFGKTWHKANNGFGKNLNVSDLIIHPTNQNILYASVLSYRCPESKNTYYGGLFITKNRGKTWSRLSTPKEALSINKVHINSKFPNTIYIATGNLESNLFKDRYISGGVYRSINGGKNWKKIFYSPYCPWVTSSPSDPNTIYVCSADPWGWGITRNPGIFRSKDGGVSWGKINYGLSSPSGPISIVCHPTKPEILWVGTTNSGWYVNKFWE